MIEHKLSEELLGDVMIKERIGLRIYPGRAPQNVKGEMIILQEITSTPRMTIDLEAGIHEKTVQIDCYAATSRAAYTLGELVRLRLSGYRGNIGTTDPTDVQSCQIINARQISERPADSSDQWIHRYSIDFSLFATATIPTFS